MMKNKLKKLSLAFGVLLIGTNGYSSTATFNDLTSQVTSNIQQKIDVFNEAIKFLVNSKQFGLVFIYDSKCPYCKKMAEVVKELQKEYGFEVFPMSADHKSINGFKNFIPMNESMFNKYFKGRTNNIKFPQLFLQTLNTKDLKFYPLSNGYTSLARVKLFLKEYGELFIKIVRDQMQKKLKQ